MRMLSREQARRVTVRAAGLAGDDRTILDVVHRTGHLQLDPTNAVARSHLLVLWSRLGTYDVAELDRLLWDERELFEWSAFVYPARDAAIFQTAMRLYPIGDGARSVYVREWLAANAAFERYVLGELERRGPLRSRELEDRAAAPWRSGGWNDGKNLSRMLEILAHQGKILVARREGAERVWDLGERVLPTVEALEPGVAARRRVLMTLRARGLTRANTLVNRASWIGWVAPTALEELEASGLVERVRVEGTDGEWIAHPEALADDEFVPRTTLLSPFDNLIHDRERTEQLFDFRYRLEIYLPKAKREYGYWVMPILVGDRIVGRVEPRFDRKTRRLEVLGAWGDTSRLDEALAELAAWLGAERVAR